MADEIWALDAWRVADSVRAGEVKAAEVLDTFLERIGRHDGEINSFVLIDGEGAHDEAELVDRKIAQGEDPGTLAGVPVGVKDLENVKGLPTGRGSLLFRDAIADDDSTHVSRLRSAGAVIVGKTTTPEQGLLGYTSSKATGVTRNPWNLERTPGGSSGGSAAAVCAGLVPIATGSDAGGSIRIPSSYTGLPGLKCTFGLIPRGPGRLASANLSVLGPIARSVRDIARYLDAVVGAAPMDPLSLPAPNFSYEDTLDRPITGLRVAWSDDLGFGACEPEVADIARRAAEKLISAAGFVEVDTEVRLPDVSSSWVIATALDCYTNFEQFWPSASEELTPVAAMMMQLADGLKPSQVARAAHERHEVLSAVTEVFQRADLLLTPTLPTTAFAADGPIPSRIDGREVANAMVSVCFTYPFNVTGHPAMTVPAGFDSEGLPVGLQLAGPRLSEPKLLSAAKLAESEMPWPKIPAPYGHASVHG